MSKYKLAIIMRTDLDMGRGKQCVQAGHASILAYSKAFNGSIPKPYQSEVKEWLEEGQFKVVLKAPHIKENGVYYKGYDKGWMEHVVKDIIGEENGLIALKTKATQLGLPVVEVRDFGKTQIEPDTLTCIAIGPSLCEDVDKITGDLKLL